MSNNELRAFNTFSISPNILINNYNADSELLEKCSELLRIYSNENLRNKSGSIVAENALQSLSKKLLDDVCKILFSQYYEKLKFCVKNNDSLATDYKTLLQTIAGPVTVTGQTDISLCYEGVCIFVWEDKKLTSNLTNVDEKAQIHVEVLAFANNFRNKTFSEPEYYGGILTSGFKWSFCTRHYHNGSQTYNLTNPISIMTDESTINEDNLALVTKCLIASLLPCVGLIRRLENFSSLARYIHHENERKSDGEQDGRDNDDNEIDEENLGSLSIQGNTRSVTKSVNKSTAKNNSERKVLGEWGNRLSETNLFIHNNPEFSYLMSMS